MKKRKILTFVVDRANYGRLKPVLLALKKKTTIESKIVASGSMILRRFKSPIDIMVEDGLKPDYQLEMEVEGSSRKSMAKSTGLGVIEFTTVISLENPDLVLVIGDRFEALAAVIASAYLDVPVAHIQGGEVSGAIDETTRHAISKFSKIHFPSTKRAAEYLFLMGEPKKSIFLTGCPVGDVISGLPNEFPLNLVNKELLGAKLKKNQPFLLVIQHPNTTGKNELNLLKTLLKTISKVNIPTVWLWPNIDAQSDIYSKEIRKHRENTPNGKISFATNFSPEVFQALLKNAACAIGNSSSFIRDTSFSGTPVVLIGNRQIGREISDNVISLDVFDEISIENAIRKQMHVGRYKVSNLYGTGNASEKIVDVLNEIDLDFEPKILDYIFR